MTLSPLALLLQNLNYDGARNQTTYKCQCPAHNDSQPSLSIKENPDGTVLIFCHAGCSTEQVLAAIGLRMSDLYPQKPQAKQRPDDRAKSTVEYEYYNANGVLMYKVVRFPPKRFAQCRPNDACGWIWNLDGVERIPYRLPELLAAPMGSWVFIPEGEKDVDNLYKHGLVATTNAQGAGKWQANFNKHFRGQHVCILPDNDSPGRKHAQNIALSLLGEAASVRVLALPNLPEKGDVSDWFEDGGTAALLLQLADQAPEFARPQGIPISDGDEFNEGQSTIQNAERKALSDTLYEIAIACTTVFIGQDGKEYATVPVDNHQECYRLQSREFHGWLIMMCKQTVGKLPSRQAQEDVILLLSWNARKTQHKVFVRVGAHEGKVYVDLGTEKWDAIEIDKDGWRLVERVPVYFRRTPALKVLPYPERGASLGLLSKYLNIEAQQWPLLAAWLVAALNSSGPYPILVISGPPGVAKSTSMRVLKELIDPSKAGMRGQPSDIRDLMIAAGNTWLLAFDNVSYLTEDISDAFCRISTGGGYAKRANYSDDGEMLLELTRPVVMNGIGDIITRPDLADRCIVINPSVIPENKRRAETEFWSDFYQNHSLLLGALLDALSTGLRRLSTVTLTTMPRMADFARLAVAAEPKFASTYGFLDSYYGNKEETHAIVLETSPIGLPLLALMQEHTQWEGTATTLLRELALRAGNMQERTPGFPKIGNKLRQPLERLAPSLRHMGIVVEFFRSSDKSGRRLIKLYRQAS